MGEVVGRHGVFLLLAGCYVVATRVRLGLSPNIGAGELLAFPLTAFLVALLFEVTRLRWHYALEERGDLPARDQNRWQLVAADLANGMLSPRRMLGGILVLVATGLFLAAFVAFKTAIPRIRPYDWDPLLARIDAAVHGGVQPWQLSHALFGGELATLAIDWSYSAWYVVIIGTLTWQAFAPHDRIRSRFLVSFLLVWIVLGSVLAAVLASGGPVYYDRLTGQPGPFEPLVTKLDHTAKRARALQEMLWRGFTGENEYLAEGISAMPSVHVGLATLLAMFGWARNRVAGLAYTAFAFLTLVGSVHLGWHYAIDGYVAAAAAVLIWFTLSRWCPAQSHPRSDWRFQNTALTGVDVGCGRR